jgi:ATP/maltotriose-dependent transcriptional regulator MalT
MSMKQTDLRVVEAWLDQWAARLDESHARIDGVKAAMAALDHEARATYDAQLRVLQEKIENARAKLEEGRLRVDALGRSRDERAGTESAWEIFKAGAEAVWNDLKQALDQTGANPVESADQNAPASREPTNDSGRKRDPA